MIYMPFLDGIRALAVIMVFIFHLNPKWLPGGFIGVDIFFVISGFLITQIIWKGLSNGTYSYGRFLWSRCKRLIPAYAFVIIATSLTGAYILLPNELIAFNESILYSIPFLTNLLFFIKSGYFEGSSEYFPLLHTWSLAVEWQFYLFFPFALLLLYKIKKEDIVRNLILFTIISAVVSIIVTPIDPSMAFYLSPFRAAEFLIGGLVSFLVLKPINVKQWKINLLVSVSFLGLLGFTIGLSKNSLFPGYYAIIVAFISGTFIFGLYKQQHGLIKSLFSAKPVVFIGKISYSFYLWHWPIILYSKLYFESIHSVPIYAFITTTTLICALLSYYFIENQFRQVKASLKAALPMLLTYSFILAVPIYLFSSTNGLSSRLTEQDRTVLNTPGWRDFPGKCEFTQQVNKFYGCTFGDPIARPHTLLWGDSHAQVLVWEYDKLAKSKSKSILSFTKGGCPPVFGGIPVNSPVEKQVCFDLQQKIFELLNSPNEITDIVIVAKWDGYTDKQLQQMPIMGNSHDDFTSLLISSIKYIQDLGYHVHLIDSIPYPGWKVPETIVRTKLLNKEMTHTYEDATPNIVFDLKDTLDINLIGLSTYFPKDYLCANGACSIMKDGSPLYFDSNHLSSDGVKAIEPILLSTLKNKKVAYE